MCPVHSSFTNDQESNNNNASQLLGFTPFVDNIDASPLSLSSSTPYQQKVLLRKHISGHDATSTSHSLSATTTSLQSPLPVYGTVGSSVKTGCGERSPQNVEYHHNHSDEIHHYYHRDTSEQHLQQHIKEEEKEEEIQQHQRSCSFHSSSMLHPVSPYPSDTIIPNSTPAQQIPSESLSTSSSLASSSKTDNMQIRILGLPESGAKSRVETQIKLCVQLVTSQGTKVPHWSFIRIPEHLLARSKLRKTQQRKLSGKMVYPAGIQCSDETKILDLSATVICVSDPNKKLRMCTGCVRRERKRAERKKDSHLNEATLSVAMSEDAFEKERDRILLFNCEPLVDFGSGDAILPTRITCYCRHHNERAGFRIRFMLCDFKGKVIATGETPSIMITDDHKSTKQPILPPPPCTSTTMNNHPVANRKRRRTDYAPATPASSRRGSMCTTGGGYEGEELLSYSTTTSSQLQLQQQYQSNMFHSFNTMDMNNQSQQHFSVEQISPLPTPVEERIPSVFGTTETVTSWSIPEHSSFPANATLASSSILNDDNNNNHLTTTSQSMASVMLQQEQTFQHAHHDTTSAIIPLTSFNNNNNMIHPNNSSTHTSPSLHTTTANITSSPTMMNHQSNNSINHMYQHRLSSSSISSSSSSSLSSSTPRIGRLIPAQGPTHGAIEITILGNNFTEGLTCLFGDRPATTVYWSQSTLVCVLPASIQSGPVVVSFKEHPLAVEGQDVALFTYYDTNDHALMELALQVVGLKMTGKLQDAKHVAIGIVQGNSKQRQVNGSSSSSLLTNNNNTNASSSLLTTFGGKSIEQRVMDAQVQDVSLVNLHGHLLLRLAVYYGYHQLAQLLLVTLASCGIIGPQDRNGIISPLETSAIWKDDATIANLPFEFNQQRIAMLSTTSTITNENSSTTHHSKEVESLIQTPKKRWTRTNIL